MTEKELPKRIAKQRCMDCKYHHCHYSRDGQDCSCGLSVFVTPTTNTPPSNCPLLLTALGMAEMGGYGEYLD